MGSSSRAPVKYVKAPFIASSAVKGAFTYLRMTTMVTGVSEPVRTLAKAGSAQGRAFKNGSCAFWNSHP
ncbi:hypothetical protein SAMN04489729_6659 [Amycolatopsis lurida]|nr:hypothetical protein SAMN04489729_6659 [Amycolatopsis lurida]